MKGRLINRRKDKIGIEIESVTMSQIWKWWLALFYNYSVKGGELDGSQSFCVN